MFPASTAGGEQRWFNWQVQLSIIDTMCCWWCCFYCRDFSNMKLTGRFPAALDVAPLSAVAVLWAYNNQLRGPIPAWFGNLTALQSLQVHMNMLTGQMPPELGNLASLTQL
jgi:hypothetical protein